MLHQAHISFVKLRSCKSKCLVRPVLKLASVACCVTFIWKCSNPDYAMANFHFNTCTVLTYKEKCTKLLHNKGIKTRFVASLMPGKQSLFCGFTHTHSHPIPRPWLPSLKPLGNFQLTPVQRLVERPRSLQVKTPLLLEAPTVASFVPVWPARSVFLSRSTNSM